ncbi:MAG: diacylglycerol kinase family lipid kinase [Acidobacteria bacterium]|nr:diacylglycerol kinase family lipid kinase [Acidobacteriota bacterium]
MSKKKVMLIYNPNAGGLHKTIDTIHRLEEALKQEGIEIGREQIIPTTCRGDATRLAALAVQQQVDFLIVCGGDGTINEAAQALIGTKTALAVLPSGTANVLAKEMNLSRQPKALAQLIANGRLREISVGQASKPDSSWQRYFLLMAGIGLDAMIIETVNPAQKKQWGIGSYVLAGLKTLLDWPIKPFYLQFNNRKCEATFAIVANAANYAAWFKIAPQSQMNNTNLDVCIFNSRSRLIYLGYAFLSLFGAHTISPDVIYEPITELIANDSNHIPVQLDGELVGHLPMRFTCIPQALRIVA